MVYDNGLTNKKERLEAIRRKTKRDASPNIVDATCYAERGTATQAKNVVDEAQHAAQHAATVIVSESQKIADAAADAARAAADAAANAARAAADAAKKAVDVKHLAKKIKSWF